MPVRPSASADEAAPHYIPLQGPVANLLARLESGWQPAAFVLPPVLTVAADGTDWTEQVVTVRIIGRELHLRLAGTAAAQAAVSIRNVEARTEGGGRLEGRVTTSSTAFDFAGTEHEVVFQCQEWAFTPAAGLALWAARLQDVREAPGPGNLHMRSQQGDRVYTSSSHMLLERPGLTTYLLETRERADQKAAWLAFNGQATPDSWPLIGKNLGLLRVLLAMPIRPGIFFGLADDGRTVAARMVPDTEAAREVATGTRSLVPLTYPETLARRVWIAPFYRRLYEQFALNGLVSFSFSRYTHTLSQFDTDTQFELVAGSVSAIIKELAARPDASPQLKSISRRMNRRTEQLAARSNDPDLPPTARPNAPPTRPESWPLRLERQLLTELAGEMGEIVADDLWQARQIFEYGALNTAQDYVANPGLGMQNYERLLRLRRTYALLLARAIGYQGPVNKFAVLHNKPLPEPETAAEITREASTYYLVSEDLSGLSAWPTFVLPTLPDSPLVQQFVKFTERIRQFTEGKVVARLRPLPKKDADPLQVSFRLLVNNAPSTQVALFTVEIAPDGLLVRGWGGGPIRLSNEGDLAQFAGQLVASEEFSLQVQRLLLIEQDIYRGEA